MYLKDFKALKNNFKVLENMNNVPSKNKNTHIKKAYKALTDNSAV